ncbi:hypothetical protein [Pusillimonas sp.]|uniref:hypothetical protein n=1 Tax=Pusillimonas sp. TaxID=3040095 RepID=UPI0037CAE429
MTYNPYQNLARFAGHNVLKNEDAHGSAYALLEAYVQAGATIAGSWIVKGKQQSKKSEIDQLMVEIRAWTELVPFSEGVARELVEKGFDWMLQHEVNSND